MKQPTATNRRASRAWTEQPWVLGAALLTDGKAKEAQAVFEKDLEQYPHNGWSTYGLMLALEAQGKTDEAAMHREHFAPIWQFADIELKTSRVSGKPT